MNGSGFGAATNQLFRQTLRSVLGAGEHEKRTLLLLEHLFQQAKLAVVFDLVEMQVDIFMRFRRGTDGNSYRVFKVLANQMGNRGFDGRRTEHRLPFGGQGREDSLDGGKEAHVEHPVRFIQHQNLNRAEVHKFAAEEVEEPPGGGDDDLRAFANGLQLGVFAHAANDDSGADAGSAGEFRKDFADLNGQFAGRAQDERADAGLAARFGQAVEQRKKKGQGLACAGLCRDHEIVAGELMRDSLGLHRRGPDKFMLGQIALQGR